MQSNRVTMDGKLNYRAWDEEPPVWSYAGPFADHQEELTQQALSVAFMTEAEIANHVSNPLPQVAVFRPRTGYPEYNARQLEIEDVVGSVSRHILHPASTWYSGGPAGYTGSPRYMSNSIGLA
jgi:hypothetical protein